MPRLYTVQFENQTIANASGDYDWLCLTAATDRPIEVIGIELSQSSEIKEAEEEQLRFSLVRGNTTASSAGSLGAITPRPTDGISTGQSFTARGADSTPASGGSPVTLGSWSWNVRAGGPLFAPLPQGAGFFTNATLGLLALRMNAAVTDDLSASLTAYVIEYP